MSGIANLRQARKRKARAAAERQAAENRVRFGRPKGERQREALEVERAARSLEGKRLRPEDS